MRNLAMGVLMAAAVFAAVVLLPATEAEAARVRVHVGGFYPGYYGPYAYGPPYYAPPVRVYTYRAPSVYVPAPPAYVPAPPAYVPAPPVYVPGPPCVRYRVRER